MKCDICVETVSDDQFVDHQIACRLSRERTSLPGHFLKSQVADAIDFAVAVSHEARKNERNLIAKEIELVLGPKHRHRSGAGPCKYCDLINKTRGNGSATIEPHPQEVIPVAIENMIPEWVTKSVLATKLWNLSKQGMDSDSAWQTLWKDGFKIQFGEVKDLFKRFGPSANGEKPLDNKSANRNIRIEAKTRGVDVTAFCKVGGSMKLGHPPIRAGKTITHFYCMLLDNNFSGHDHYISNPSKIEIRYRDKNIPNDLLTREPNGWLKIDFHYQPILRKGETLFLFIWK